jgi:hypothetical protein
MIKIRNVWVLGGLLSLAGLGFSSGELVQAGTFSAGMPAGWMGQGNFGTQGAALNIASSVGDPYFAYIATNMSGSPQNGGISTGVPMGFTNVPGATFGSTLTSAPFTVAAGGALQVDFGFLTNDGDTFSDFAYAELRQAGTSNVVATLFNADTTGTDTSPSSNASPAFNPDVLALHGISAGVTVASALFDGVQTGNVGGIMYGPSKYPDDPTTPGGAAGPGGFTGWVTASYTPGAGNYQLFFVTSNLLDDVYPSALVIGDVRGASFSQVVPEPSSLTMAVVGLLGVLWSYRRQKRTARAA